MHMKAIVLSILLGLWGGEIAYAKEPKITDADLKAARLDENPVTLKKLLESADDYSAEHLLSQAFFNSRTQSGENRVFKLEQWIEDHPTAPLSMRIFAHQQLGQSYFAQTKYAKAALALQTSIDLAPTEATQEMRDATELAKIAASTPPIQRVGEIGTVVTIRTDIANQKRTNIEIAGNDIPMIVDTGAEISVIAESQALKAEMKFLDGSVSVGTVTEDVSGKLALASTINIGTMRFKNVLFLVLPDKQLTFADGAYFVDGIIGLPVFTAAGRIGWRNSAQELLLGTQVTLQEEQTGNTLWHKGGMAIQVAYNDKAFPAFLDSGASKSSLTMLFMEHLNSSEHANLESFDRTITGVGGAIQSQATRLPQLTLKVANKPVTFKDIVIANEKLDEAAADIAILGSDMLMATQSFTIDFGSMTYQVTLEP
ncbi:retropepsin-like domain-containing protein [Kordiimonas aquimaris]|uniref:retropepsin-like domain-containing protein n=1 Tax=Kordiimonas aquimaris TaxID=707591 RepID=UPI0021CF22BF|nr:retropepsin-like domain-containing protein [Kordiimonas aquimaris]